MYKNCMILPSLNERYLQITFEQVERFMFYERARRAFAVVHTGYVYTVYTVHTQYSTLRVTCMENGVRW